MADYVITLNAVANGAVNPSTFVKGDVIAVSATGGPTVPTQDLGVIGATGGTTTEVLVGVSGRYTVALPVAGSGSTAEAATAGDNILIYPAGSICLLAAGATWSPWAYLKPNSTGQGIAASSGDVVGAIALTQCNNGSLGRVLVLPPGSKMP